MVCHSGDVTTCRIPKKNKFNHPPKATVLFRILEPNLDCNNFRPLSAIQKVVMKQEKSNHKSTLLQMEEILHQ